MNNRRNRRQILRPPKKELEELLERGYTQIQIAEHYTKERSRKVSRSLVQKWLDYYKLLEERPKPPKEEFKQLYVVEKKTHQELADFYSKKWGIPVSRKYISKIISGYQLKRKRPRKEYIPPRKEFEELVNKGFNKTQIRDYYSKKENKSFARKTVDIWLDFYELKIIKLSKYPFTADEVRYLYVDKRMSQRQVAAYLSDKYGGKYCQQNIWQFMEDNDIPARKRYIPPEEELRELYLVKGMSIRQIAEHYTKILGYSVSKSNVSRWLIRYKIPTRDGI
ncbi:MAG: hypothetical protein ACFFBD_04825, partial [Candidatus Hodarchaeota archaeon]